MSAQNPKPLPEDQFSPQELVAILIIAKNAIIRNWAIALVTIVLGAGVGYMIDRYKRTPMLYEASVIFNLGAAGSSAGTGGLASLLGMGPASDANIFPGDNFFYFVTSRPVIEQNLMKELTINGQKQILANFYIDSSGIKVSEWQDKPDLQKFHFTTTDIKKMDTHSRVALNSIVKRISKATKIDNVDLKTSFISLSVKMENERLAAMWVTALLKTVEGMYIDNQTQKTRRTLQMLKDRADSLQAVLSTSERRLARQLDLSAQVFMPEEKVAATSMSRKSAFIQQLYNEALANAERTRVSLVREASLFTEIEGVKTPLDASYEEKKSLKLGALVGVMLAMIFIYFKTVFSSAQVLYRESSGS